MTTAVLCFVMFSCGVFVGLIVCAAEMEHRCRQRLQAISDHACKGIEEITVHTCSRIEEIGNRLG